MEYVGTEPLRIAGRIVEPGDNVDDLDAAALAGLVGRPDFVGDPPTVSDAGEGGEYDEPNEERP